MSNDKWKMNFLFNNPQQMGHLSNRPAHRRRVRTLDNLIQFAQTQTADDLFLRLRKRDRAAIVLNLDLCRRSRVFALLLRRHNLKLETVFTVLPPVSRASARLQKDLSF